MTLSQPLQAHAVLVAVSGRRVASEVAGWLGSVVEGDANADRALTVGVGMEGLAQRAGGEAEAAHPLGRGRVGAVGADPPGAAVAELVAVERVPEVEELGATL